MATVNTYLNFNGNCEEAFNFYKSIFGGEFNYVGRFSEMPEGGGFEVPESFKNKIMHIGLSIGNTLLMGSDTIEGDWAPPFVQGNNFSISIHTESKEEADKLFQSLSVGGQITMPMDNTFWGDYFGMFTDKFGINWMVNFALKE
ncbi:VOC family protein [Wenyingzhuangia marina]|uniref:PhnB protein n=1 Tax=Wenyingzhuangia marina TaxID=1195760 RepID=A0A1M5SJE7_9FLAO|nr:VOC family protein [Wenyingzhuangia marina]GGF62499.1 VOC family protein [Wenyingzhuangia marina]SHH38575.1 PhnB protein [Wenyingzhuangia marina]